MMRILSRSARFFCEFHIYATSKFIPDESDLLLIAVYLAICQSNFLLQLLEELISSYSLPKLSEH